MKAWKYIAIVLGLIAVLLITSWVLRNSIIQRLSKPLLGQFGVTITDVSLDALATRDASISYLELEHENGTIVVVDDLTLPIRTAPTGVKTYTVEKVSLKLPIGSNDEQVDLAGLLRQLLALPLTLPNTVIDVAELNATGYPVIRDLRWQLTADSQQMSALVDPIVLTANIERISDTTHALDVSLTDSLGAGSGRSVSLDIHQADAALSISGTSTVDLPTWTPIATLLEFNEINVASGTADLRIDTTLGDDQAPVLHADLTPTTPVQLTYARAPEAITSITVESASTIEVSASLADGQWSLRQADASIRVSDGDWNEIPVALANLACESGVTCSTDVSITMDDAALPLANVGKFEFSATQDIELGGDGMRVAVRPDARLSIKGISGPDVDLAGLTATLTSTAQFRTDDEGWHFSAQAADLEIESFSVLDNLGFSAQLFLDEIAVGDTGQVLSAKAGAYASSSQATLNGQVIQLPGFKGGVVREDAEVAVFLETDGLFAEASVEARHNLDNESGQLALSDASLSFDMQTLANRIRPWRNDWDVRAGTIGFDLRAAWQKRDTGWRVEAQSTIEIANLAGAWNDTAFAGLSTRIDTGFDTETGFAAQPSTIEIALIEMGLSIEDISAAYAMNLNEQSVEVEDLRMTAFGGVITADPFSFSTANASNTVRLRAESIDLAEILSIKEFEAIEISGRIGAELPMTIEGQTVRIEGGILTGEPPGGVIRYLPGIAAEPTDASGIGIATRALSNFEYDTLTSEVDYTAGGDLVLQMRLTGRNPDLESNRPVILNFGLENNVPQMLKSLQAARAVEEILEKRLAQ